MIKSIFLTLVFALIWLCVATGCKKERSTEQIFDNYLNRLSNGLNLKGEKSERRSPLITYPAKRVLTYNIPKEKINFLQFLQLSKCELQRLIGQRNGSLGKLISGYHSLLYHREFLLLAQKCLQSMAEDDSLYAALSGAIIHKLTYREQTYWNALFAGDEFRYLFSVSSQALSPENIANKPIELIQSLEVLNSWVMGSELEPHKLSEAYQSIEKTKWIGQLRLSMLMAREKLMQADALIQHRLTQRPLCFKPQANRRFNIVKNVFYEFYIAEVQVMLAKLHQQADELFRVLHKLQSSQKTHSDFAHFWSKVYLAEDSEWQEFNRIISTHTKSWQQLLKQCGFEPGKSRDLAGVKTSL